MRHSDYIGRFAPSPSGPLHMGSLVTALGSYLRARINNGKWLLRIDDIDPPRIMSGAIDSIQTTLKAHALVWDDDVVFQSQNSDSYDRILYELQQQNLLYRCECTRAQIKSRGHFYQGTCKDKSNVEPPYSLRIKNQFQIDHIEDIRLGVVAVDSNETNEDFIVKRKDGLYAYHLASVVDDINMGVTEIVRGEDLISATACQWALFKTLKSTPPLCLHLPLVTFADGRKFSKQNHAPALDLHQPEANLIAALGHLGFIVPNAMFHSDKHSILNWATQAWADAFSNS